MQGAYAEILADVVKSLEERLGQNGQGRDARAFELDLIDGEPCGTGPAVPGRRDDQIGAQFEERPRRGLGFGQILGDAAEGGVRFIRFDEFGVRKGAGQQRVQVIEQKIAVVFAVPAQDHALAREIGRPRGRIVERRQIVPYGQAFPRHGLLSTGRKGQQEYGAQRDQNLSHVNLLRFFGKKAARSVCRRDGSGGR